MKITVLLIDDEPLVCTGVMNRLNRMSLPEVEQIECFHDGGSALEFIRENPEKICLALVDINMPGMSGLAFIKEAKALTERVGFLVLSAYREFDYAQEALRMNVFDYLVKPVLMEQFQQAMEKALERLRVMFDDDALPEAMSGDTSEATIRRALQYIDNHLERDIDMATVANQFDLSYSYFSMLFKKHTGSTFQQYIKEKKMLKAASLLGGGYGVQRIAEMLGYANAKNFTRAFKEYYGVSPEQWHNQADK